MKYTGRDEDFQNIIIENWKKIVKPEDMVIHLGDLSAGVKGRWDEIINIFDELPGSRILIRGNHDHRSEDFYLSELGFEAVYDYLILEDMLFTHYPLEITKYSKEHEIKNVKMLTKLVETNGITKIIHGHTHARETGLPNHYNCSVECINLSPILLEDLLARTY